MNATIRELGRWARRQRLLWRLQIARGEQIKGATGDDFKVGVRTGEGHLAPGVMEKCVANGMGIRTRVGQKPRISQRITISQ